MTCFKTVYQLVFRSHLKRWLLYIELWGKLIQRFMRNLLIMAGVEAICWTWLISKMILVPTVYNFTFTVWYMITWNSHRQVHNISRDMLHSMGLFCMGSDICLIFGGKTGMLSSSEIWRRSRSPCKISALLSGPSPSTLAYFRVFLLDVNVLFSLMHILAHSVTGEAFYFAAIRHWK